MGKIYRLESPSGKSYVGQTVHTIEQRIKQHVRCAETNPEKGCRLINRAIAKYGIDNFIRHEVIECENSELDYYEIKFIAKYNTCAPFGYNLTGGGGGTYHASAETRQKMSESQRSDESPSKGLPAHIIYVNSGKSQGFAINHHKRCDSKFFTIKKYGSIEDAKHAVLRFYDELQNNPTFTYAKEPKKGDDLPKGISMRKNGYVVEIMIKKIKHIQYFIHPKYSMNENLQMATACLTDLRAGIIKMKYEYETPYGKLRSLPQNIIEKRNGYAVAIKLPNKIRHYVVFSDEFYTKEQNMQMALACLNDIKTLGKPKLSDEYKIPFGIKKNLPKGVVQLKTGYGFLVKFQKNKVLQTQQFGSKLYTKEENLYMAKLCLKDLQDGQVANKSAYVAIINGKREEQTEINQLMAIEL